LLRGTRRVYQPVTSCGRSERAECRMSSGSAAGAGMLVDAGAEDAENRQIADMGGSTVTG